MTTARDAKSAFVRATRLGTGRAYLVAQAHPEVDFSPFIIQAALKNFAYDGQSEPSRAAYLYELYCLVPQQARIRRAVLRALATERDDTWTLTQLFKLTLLFAQDGDAAARKALYHRFLRNPISGSHWAGAHEIITLDGLAGLHHIARKYGQLLAKSPERWQNDSLITFFEERHPTVDAWASMRQLATHDEDVRRYLHTIAATEARRDTQHLTRQRSGAYETPSLTSLIQRPHSAYVRGA